MTRCLTMRLTLAVLLVSMSSVPVAAAGTLRPRLEMTAGAAMNSYRNLPPLAGLCTIEDAAKPGLSVEECVRRLKRFHYAFVRLHEILTARITSEPIYELKTAFAHHAYLCAEHATAIRQRVGEMREPPLGLEEVPHPALAGVLRRDSGCCRRRRLVSWRLYRACRHAASIVHRVNIWTTRIR